MRLHIVLAVLTALALYLTFHGAPRAKFTFAQVQELAKQRAAQKFQPLPDALPPALKKLSPQQELGVFWNDRYRLWRNAGLPFQIDFFPLSNDQHTSPAINIVDRHGAQPLVYSNDYFHLDVPFSPPLPPNIGYGGFYVRYPNMAPKSDPKSPLDGFFSVKGASYFRALGRGQEYGLSGRALAINSVTEHDEEFPQFVAWWLYQPGPNASSMVLDALLDSASVTGAYEFTLRPGDQTSIDVRATLYFRKTVPLLGMAPFSSMYDYGENAKNHYGNTSHPEIHDSDGLLVHTSRDEWLWRPLEQDTQRQVYNIADENPRGFGLLQRDRDAQHYQDPAMDYQLRPSAFVTPRGDWGKGAVQINHLVTDNSNTDNVVLQWHPDATPQAGSRLDFSYTIDFYTNDASRPPLAYVTQTLIDDPAPPPPPPPPKAFMGPPAPPNLKPKPGTKTTAVPARIIPPPAPPPPSPNTPDTVQFSVDFTGNGIENLAPDHKPAIDLSISENGKLRESTLQKNDYSKSWRVTFAVIPTKLNVPVELQLKLKDGNRPLTETWTYTWPTPARPR